MNENPELGSLWKGRILMQVFAVKTAKPVYKIQQINQADCEYSNQFKVNRVFRFMVQVNSAIALPKPDTKYEIAVRIADKEITTGEAVFNKGSYNRFNYRTEVEDAKFEGPYLNIDDIGGVFVYLKKKFKIGGVKNISFYRGYASSFTDLTPENLTWVQLMPDKAINEVKEPHKAGLVGLKISIRDVTKEGGVPLDWKENKVWGKRMPRRPGNKKVRAYVFQCRDIPAADSDGTSDPFLEFLDSDVPQRTTVVYDNLNPIYYQAIEMMYEANCLEELPPFIIDCYDEDQTLVGKNDADYLSRATIYYKDAVEKNAITENDEVPTPVWFPMRFSAKGPTSGEVLISFAVVDDDFSFKKTLEYVHLEKDVPMADY